MRAKPPRSSPLVVIDQLVACGFAVMWLWINGPSCSVAGSPSPWDPAPWERDDHIVLGCASVERSLAIIVAWTLFMGYVVIGG